MKSRCYLYELIERCFYITKKYIYNLEQLKEWIETLNFIIF